MVDTTDFEHLLDVPNVVGVEYDETTDTVKAFVTEKVPESELPPDAIVSNVVTGETDVLESGEIRLLDATDPSHFRERHRPVVGGVSEGPYSRRSAGTGGPFRAVVREDTTHFDDSVSKGDVVRLSNNHVYADGRFDAGNYGERIVQPARLDGGTSADVVGNVVGYVPFEDGVTVDVAARTTGGSDLNRYAGFDATYGARGVLRDMSEYDSLLGSEIVKAGRTTGVTRSDVTATSASVNVRMGGDKIVLFRDQIVAGDMSAPGDSGSAVFRPDGTLVGMLFAGSDTTTIVNKASRIEDAFGVRFDTSSAEPAKPAARQEITVSRNPRSKRSMAFSFGVSAGSDVDFGKKKSTTVINNRVNGYVTSWTNRYRIDGYVTDASIPDDADVTLDGETVHPDRLADASKELAEANAATDDDV